MKSPVFAYQYLFCLFELMLYVPINNFSHVETISCVFGLNHCLAADKVSCLRIQHCDSGESRTSKPSIPTKYKLKQRVLLSVQTLFHNCLLHSPQSELSWPIPQNSVESDHGCTSMIYFDNAGDNLSLTLYNVTLTSQKPC